MREVGRGTKLVREKRKTIELPIKLRRDRSVSYSSKRAYASKQTRRLQSTEPRRLTNRIHFLCLFYLGSKAGNDLYTIIFACISTVYVYGKVTLHMHLGGVYPKQEMLRCVNSVIVMPVWCVSLCHVVARDQLFLFSF